MKEKNTISVFVVLITLFSAIAASFGILSDFGPGVFEYETIRGQAIEIYGKGIYHHMSADVAIQGIAQDYITLFVAIPLLIGSLLAYRKNSLRALFLLAGTLGYFLVTYLFYTAMGMYNIMFLPYVILLCLSFFGFFLTIKRLSQLVIVSMFSLKTPKKFVGWFLIANSVSIAFLWLSIIVPPLLDGSIYPVELDHYTTLIVQGFDLGLLLPICFVSGILLLKKKAEGYLYSTIYLVFLSILMTALTAKIIAMAMNDVNVIPVIFIIPSINIITITGAVLMVKSIIKSN
ncbi:MAG: hypothetical protein Q8R90_09115 [Bacteroidales bacterium]|jgi:hypothetical protein|nr:hypothetical protein [Bacteroidales bacterium]